MRGKLGGGEERRAWPRIIPAHAGQTHAACRSSVGSPDHPRACGANCANESALSAVVGSSPRMRGKPMIQRVHVDFPRIIPAHAGQTAMILETYALRSDHPRACGANGVWGTFNIRGHGSSPRMRGKPIRKLGFRHRHRIIPAHAGQTALEQVTHNPPPDHPRACGANYQRLDRVGGNLGSSPRMRGKLGLAGVVGHQRRIIPAHAGQTPDSRREARGDPDHPRACGANQAVGESA